MTSDQVNRETVRNVADDLVFLTEDWDQDVTDASLRRSSVVLRRLLVEDELGRAWRAAANEAQPLVEAVSLEDVLKGVPFLKVRWAQAGGAVYRGMQIMAGTELSVALTAEQIKQGYARFKNGLPVRKFTVRKLMESACVVSGGKLIPRRSLIKYVANKLGGAHPVDPRRNPDKLEERHFQLLDLVRGERFLAEKCAIYFELLAIGQALVKSEDIQKFINRERG